MDPLPELGQRSRRSPPSGSSLRAVRVEAHLSSIGCPDSFMLPFDQSVSLSGSVLGSEPAVISS